MHFFLNNPELGPVSWTGSGDEIKRYNLCRIRIRKKKKKKSNLAWFLLPWLCMTWTDGSSVYFNHNIYLEYSNILNLIPAVAIAGIIETFE
jgi:hypothetical protein